MGFFCALHRPPLPQPPSLRATAASGLLPGPPRLLKTLLTDKPGCCWGWGVRAVSSARALSPCHGRWLATELFDLEVPGYLATAVLGSSPRSPSFLPSRVPGSVDLEWGWPCHSMGPAFPTVTKELPKNVFLNIPPRLGGMMVVWGRELLWILTLYNLVPFTGRLPWVL